MNTLFKPTSAASGNSGGTGKNYLTTYLNNPGNGDFENASTSGFALGTTGTLTNGLPTGTPAFGSGASGNLSLSLLSGGNQIGGNYSAALVSSAATTQGNMLHTDAFAIDKEDQAKVLGGRIYYSATNGSSNANWSGTSLNSFGVAVYDITNSAWLQTVGAFNFVQSSGVGICTFTVQTAATTASMRVCLYNANATSGAITLLTDDWSIGPQVIPSGFAGTDPNFYTPTISAGFGTTSNVSFKAARSGKFLVGEFTFTMGTGAASSANFTLPAGLQIDTSLIPNNTSLGTWYGSQTKFQGSLTYFTSAGTNVIVFSDGTTTYVNGMNGNAWAASSVLSGNFVVPIVGWSSNSVMSNDTDTRVVDFVGASAAAQVLTANTTKIAFTSKKDSHGAWNGTDYVVPVAGDYRISLSYYTTGSGSVAFYVQVNGADPAAGRTYFGVGGTTQSGSGSTILYNLKANDVVTMLPDASVTLSAVNRVISIDRLSGPAVVQATESVNARYNTSSTSIANTGENAVLFTVKDYDTHNAFNTSTGIYTAPVAGKYQISSSVIFGSATYTSLNAAYLIIYKNGTNYSVGGFTSVDAAVTRLVGIGIVDQVNLNAGDTIQIRASNSRTAGATSLDGNARNNYFSIARVGN